MFACFLLFRTLSIRDLMVGKPTCSQRACADWTRRTAESQINRQPMRLRWIGADAAPLIGRSLLGGV